MRAPSRRLALVGSCLVALGLIVTLGPPVLELLAKHVGRAPLGAVSFELGDAPPAPTAERRVALWLRLHERDIVASEARFHVDRRAIAAAIAYEALADPRIGAYGYAARFSGPGKVHYREHRLSEGDPAAKQVEDNGLMPKLAPLARRKALTHASIAIEYIGAIMYLFGRHSPQPAELSCDVPLLATLYTSLKPSDLKVHPIADVGQNAAGRWTAAHAGFLSDSVGAASPRVCRG